MNDINSDETQTETFRDLLKDFDTAVMVPHSQETNLRARPMVLAGVDDDCSLWFISAEDSAKALEIETDTHVLVVCQKGCTSFVSVSGHASLSRDRAKIHEFWKTIYRVWFPHGADDPSIVLIHVVGEHGEYWDNTGVDRFTYAYRAIKAFVAGTTPEVTEGEQHGHIDLVHGQRRNGAGALIESSFERGPSRDGLRLRVAQIDL